GGALERELCTDDRPDRTLLPELQDVSCRTLDEVGPSAHQSVQEEAVYPDVAADEPSRAYVLPETAGVADRDRGSQWLHEPERCDEDLAADEVEDRVDGLELGDLLVGHALDRSEGARKVELRLVPDGGDRGAVERADDLHRCRADRTCGGGDEDARAERDPREFGERDPGRQERHGEGGPFGETRARGEGQEPARI